MNIVNIKIIPLLFKHRREETGFCLHFTGEICWNVLVAQQLFEIYMVRIWSGSARVPKLVVAGAVALRGDAEGWGWLSLGRDGSGGAGSPHPSGEGVSYLKCSGWSITETFFGLWTKVTPKEFILSRHFPNSFGSENNEGIFIWKNVLKEETWRKGINSSLEYKGATVYIWLSCPSRQFLRTTVWLHDYKRYRVTAGLIDSARNCSTDTICNLSRPYFCRKRVPLFASSISRANHVCCSHSETCSQCNARCSRRNRLRTGLFPW